MNRLKKYFCKTNISNLELLSQYEVSDLKRVDDNIYFYLNEANYLALSKIIVLEAKEIKCTRIINLLKKQLITIIGLLLITLALINQSIAVIGVRFTNNDTYNENILIYIEKFYKNIGPFSYLNEDLTTINTDLRKTFYQYEWIGIRKKGSYLYLDIKDIKNTNYEEDPRPGSYYATYSGIIKRYHVEKGIILIQEEQYVSSGDTLISGRIPHYGEKEEFIKAKGYVIAEVLEYKEYVVPKENLEIIKTGKLIKSTDVYLFNKKIGVNKNTFFEFDKEEQSKFNILNIFHLRDVYYYETKSVKTIYTKTDAIDYTKSLVIKEFRSNKVNPFEKIIFNELVKIEEDNQNYYVKLIVKTYQNIAQFIPDEIRQ